ncbi:hypothetical protein UNPF46_10755 [Bradyrhizobium sp. UNPF46]|nr:hypothetical protein UNPF46_10755 [Bradyrhizobium sp. UNPF46]
MGDVLTSEATTAKPRPASPARAASMVALSARRLVSAAIAWRRCHVHGTMHNAGSPAEAGPNRVAPFAKCLQAGRNPRNNFIFDG